MSDLDDFKATYFDECSELLLELEEQFHAIEDGDRSANRLNAVFRAIHSIKGGGGAFGFADLVAFAHAYETLLDHVRDGRIELADHVAVLCIRANDIVADFVAAAKDGVQLAPGYGDDEKAQFDALTSGNDPDMAGEPMEEFDIDFVPVMVQLGGAEDAPEPITLAPPAVDSFEAAPMIEGNRWIIRFTPHSELYARANDPLLLFRELSTLGQLEVRTRIDEIPPLADFEPFGVYCSWEITLTSATAGEA
jgi:two-component system chemotaxis sensor kinase CheA